MPESSRAMEATEIKWVSLGSFSAGDHRPGRSVLVRILWYFVSLIVFESGWFPVYGFKRWLLRSFGAVVGCGVVIKPHVRIKYPWRLQVGSYCWIGEDAWIDNLADVGIEDDVCISQGAYVCTGSHDRRRVTFDLIVRPIVIEAEAWIAARAVILPGVTVGRGAIVAAGSIVSKDVPPGIIVGGSPARVICERDRVVPAD